MFALITPSTNSRRRNHTDQAAAVLSAKQVPAAVPVTGRKLSSSVQGCGMCLALNCEA
jgi:hypothetical protein